MVDVKTKLGRSLLLPQHSPPPFFFLNNIYFNFGIFKNIYVFKYVSSRCCLGKIRSLYIFMCFCRLFIYVNSSLFHICFLRVFLYMTKFKNCRIIKSDAVSCLTHFSNVPTFEPSTVSRPIFTKRIFSKVFSPKINNGDYLNISF